MILTRMREIMEDREISPYKLTAELGISASSFTDWSKGKGAPSVAVLAKFAEYFYVSLDYLILGREYTPDGTYVVPQKQKPAMTETEKELLGKFQALPSDCQSKVSGYIDGMIAVLPTSKMRKKH